MGEESLLFVNITARHCGVIVVVVLVIVVPPISSSTLPPILSSNCCSDVVDGVLSPQLRDSSSASSLRQKPFTYLCSIYNTKAKSKRASLVSARVRRDYR